MRYIKTFENFHHHHPVSKIEPPEVTPHEAHEYVEKKKEQKEIEKEHQDCDEPESTSDSLNNNIPTPNE